MTPRPCYPMDVPVGARLLDFNDRIVVAVRVNSAAGQVELEDKAGRKVRVPMTEQVTIDEDTRERRERLALARAIMGGPSWRT